MLEINKIYNGDVLDTLKTFDDKGVDSVITSPPYWQLRDYGWNGQWGLEKTYQEYLEHLWLMMDEVWRVLKNTGTVWINLGDSYNTISGGTRGLVRNDKNYGKISQKAVLGQGFEQIKDANIPSKCLLLIPHRFAIGCIDRGWILRNDIIWAKRNGMPESVTDRFSKKHEFFFFFVKQQKYYFDLDGVRDKHQQVSLERSMRGLSENNKWVNGADGQTPHHLSQPRKNTKIEKKMAELMGSPRARNHREDYNYNPDVINPNGKNPGDVSDFWDVPTQPSSEKHYATYSFDLIDKPIIAGCPEDGIILDPFAGTGTTLLRAIDLRRKGIGIEGKKEYCDMFEERFNERYGMMRNVL
jgi:DNA modification methylase